MPSFVTHLVVSSLVLGSTRLVNWRYVVLLAPVAVLPDLDFFIPPHRAVLTNIWWPLLLGLAAWRLHHHDRPEWVAVGVASYYWASHVVMDLFVGGVVPFWPFWDQTFLLLFAVLVNTETLEAEFVTSAGSFSGPPDVSPVFTWISPEETAMLAFVTLSFGVLWLSHWWRERDAVVLERADR